MIRYKSDGRVVILHVIEGLFSKGGTPRKLLSLVENGDKERFVHIFLLFNNYRADDLSDDVRRAGGIVKEVSRPRNYDIRFLFDIIRMVRKHKVDIINTHFARSDIFGVLVGMMCGIPVIKSVHGVAWNNSTLLIYADRMLARFRYLTTCNSAASIEAERQRSHAKTLKVIHNGVVPRECNLTNGEVPAYREKLGIPPNCFIVGHVGSLIELRRQDLILDAISIMYEKGIDVYCAIVGKGSEDENLKDYAKSLKITDCVKFLGCIDDVGEFLSSIDVYVNMANAEGFGIAVVEAMFAGLPVVLANAGAHPELIVDGDSGILVSEGSSQELADAMTRLAGDSSLRRRLGEGGKKRANEKFAISRFVRDFENLYETCVKETGGKAM